MREPTKIFRANNKLLQEIAQYTKDWNTVLSQEAERYEIERLKLVAGYEKKISELEKQLKKKEAPCEK